MERGEEDTKGKECGGVIGCMAYAQQFPTSGFKESLTLCEEEWNGVAQLSEI